MHLQIVNPKGEMKGSAITGPVGKEAAELWPVGRYSFKLNSPCSWSIPAYRQQLRRGHVRALLTSRSECDAWEWANRPCCAKQGGRVSNSIARVRQKLFPGCSVLSAMLRQHCAMWSKDESAFGTGPESPAECAFALKPPTLFLPIAECTLLERMQNAPISSSLAAS